MDFHRLSHTEIRAVHGDFPVMVNTVLEVLATVATFILLLVATYPPFPSVIVRVIVFPVSADHPEIVACIARTGATTVMVNDP